MDLTTVDAEREKVMNLRRSVEVASNKILDVDIAITEQSSELRGVGDHVESLLQQKVIKSNYASWKFF